MRRVFDADGFIRRLRHMSRDEWWQTALSDVFAGRDVVLAGAVPPAWTDIARHLTEAGAERLLIIATEGAGVGPGPDAPTVVVDHGPELGLLERIRRSNATLARPPAPVLAALNEFDPDRGALVVGSFLNETPALDGRPFLAYRRREWVALEDKTVIDGFWERAGVAHLPSAVVPLDQAHAVARDLDGGHGTVWAADAREGFHGGAALTRWVHDLASAERARADLAGHCDTVRVMPFAEGIPCSIHGMVLADGDAVLRPVEMVTLRSGTEFRYAGCATFWDPPAMIREQMRRVARQAAAQLRAEVDFRGTFTVDGVVAADGFWPTELNPRYGAGINTITRAVGDIPILLLHDLAVAGLPVGTDADSVERTLVEAADAKRGGGTWMANRTHRTLDERPVEFRDGRWQWTPDETSATARFVAGNGFARATFDPAHTPVGPSVAPRAAALWNFVADAVSGDFGTLTAAPDPFGATH